MHSGQSAGGAQRQLKYASEDKPESPSWRPLVVEGTEGLEAENLDVTLIEGDVGTSALAQEREPAAPTRNPTNDVRRAEFLTPPSSRKVHLVYYDFVLMYQVHKKRAAPATLSQEDLARNFVEIFKQARAEVGAGSESRTSSTGESPSPVVVDRASEELRRVQERVHSFISDEPLKSKLCLICTCQRLFHDDPVES